MNIRNIAILLVAVSAVVLALLLLSAAAPASPGQAGGRSLDILEIGRAGDYGYAVLSYNGTANITMLAYSSQPLRKVTIINEPGAVSNSNISWFMDSLSGLENYGFDVSLSDKRVLGHGIFLVPSGAMPSYVLDDLRNNVTDGVVVYVGRSDIVLEDSGVKKEDWYSALDERQRARIVLYNVTPDEFMENGSASAGPLSNGILENSWAVSERSDTALSGEGRYTAILLMNGSQYLRLIAAIGGKAGMVDSARMAGPKVVISPSPDSIFPWEKTTLDFALNKTNGTPVLSISKDGQEVFTKQLSRVREENFFPERVNLSEPGNHVVRVIDNSGTIASGIIHVKDLEVAYAGSAGLSYLFNVTVDGEPLDKGEALVHLSNSTDEKTFYISGGELTVPAQLHQGTNVFGIQLLGTEKDVDVTYSQEGLADVYIKYGIPGIILVVAIYFGARMTRRPVYVIRVGELAGEVRKEVRLPPQRALSLFKSIRKELGIGGSPLSAHEFAIALKRHVTEGADVTDGNVEEILQALVKRGALESHRQYYQLKGEGDVRRNSMVRRIRDKLIEAGVQFRTKGRRFVTDHLEIGFFGDKFAKNAAVVVEDPQELESIYASLDQKELAALRVKLANGVLRFVTLDKLDDVL